jgi:predicted phage terminase large subunit-like protein
MHKLNVYIIVDPANTKKKRSDYTAIMVVGYGNDDNFYILDMIRDRLTLTEKARILMELHRQYKPLKVGYEVYGLQADIEHIKYIQQQETYNFHITELGGKVSKEDRIVKLMPLFEQHRIFLPDRCMKTNYEGMTVDLTQAFINEEFLAFPFGPHDDMLDCLSRILDDDLSVRPPGEKSFRAGQSSVAIMDYEPFK